MTRPPASLALTFICMLLVAATAVSGYARAELSDPEAFAARATAALDDPDVRAVVAGRVAGEVTRPAPSLLNIRPLLAPAVGALIDSRPLRRAFERALTARHERLAEREAPFELELGGAIRLIRDGVRSVSPRAARAIPADLRLRVTALDHRGFELTVARIVKDIADLFWPLVVATLLCAGACVALAGGVRRAVLQLGAALAGAGLTVAAAVSVLGMSLVSHAADAGGFDDEVERGAVAAIWDVLMGDLVASALVAALVGVALAALAAGAPAKRPMAATAGWAAGVARSDRAAAHIGRSAAAVAVGVALILDPLLGVRVLLVCAGVGLLVGGVAALSARVLRERSGDGGSAWPLVAAAVTAVVVAGVAILLIVPGPGGAPAPGAALTGACNGSRQLCARRLDEVVFPATHNSYAAADERGWFFASQQHAIARQLEDGIRALLIDIHYGRRDRDRGVVRTDLAYEGSSRNKVLRELGPEAVSTAERLAGRVGAGELEGERGVYLCHTLCELGSEPLRAQLELVGRFLAENRREVVILFIEPYVRPDDIERAMRDAGLLGQAAELRRDRPLPTLRQLIRRGTRLVVLAEDDGGARPWYPPGFSFVQDTPLGATTPTGLSCARFRGDPDSPLLLLNHWIPPFPPSVRRNAAIGGEFLLRRVRRCGRARRVRANLLAVDFYEHSGVVEIAQRLNEQRR